MSKTYVSPTMKYKGSGQVGTVTPQCCDVGAGLMLAIGAIVWDVVAIVNVAVAGMVAFKGLGPSC